MKCEYCNSEINFDDLNCPYCYFQNENYYKNDFYDINSLYPNVLLKNIYSKNLFKKKTKRYLFVIFLILFFIFTFPLGFILYCIFYYIIKKLKRK